jgi:hypothetical protein
MSQTIEIIRGDGGDEPPCLETGNPRFGDLVARRLKRRDVLAGALATAVAALFVRPGDGRAAKDGLDFNAVPVSRADSVAVPEGYRVQFILPWGEPILGRIPAFTIDNSGKVRRCRSVVTMTGCISLQSTAIPMTGCLLSTTNTSNRG